MRILLALLFSLTASASVDYSAGFGGRMYPLGSAFFLNGGYSFKIWDKATEDKKWNYGYIRPSANFQTIGSVNNFEGQLEIFPIAFAGLYTGYSYSSRENNKLPTFDCDTLVCRSSGVVRTYFGAKYALKFKKWFAFGDHRIDNTETTDNEQIFADEKTALILGPKEDDVTTHRLGFGRELSEKMKVGALVVLHESDKTKQEADMKAVFLSYQKNKEWSFTGGPGIHTSRDDDKHFTMFLIIRWVGEKGLTLF